MAHHGVVNPQTGQIVYQFFDMGYFHLVQSPGPPYLDLDYTDQFHTLRWPHNLGSNKKVSPFWKQDYAFGQRVTEAQLARQLDWKVGLVLVKKLAGPANNLFDNQVWLVRDPDTKQQYVLKVCNLRYYTDMRDDTIPDDKPEDPNAPPPPPVKTTPVDTVQQSVGKMLREVRTLLYLRHPNITTIYDYFSLENFDMNFPVHYHCYVMDVMKMALNDLQGAQPDRIMTEPEAFDWFTQIAGAVNYLHNGIPGYPQWFLCHLAIRPSNILYREVIPGHRIYKLTDFEESRGFRRTGDPNEDVLPYPFGVRWNQWSAPELRPGGQKYCSSRHARPMDMYSLGMTLCTNLIGFRMIRDKDNNPQVDRLWWPQFVHYTYSQDITNLDQEQRDVYPNVSPFAQMIIGRCMNPYAHLRSTIQAILQSLETAPQNQAMNQQ